jgi:hypothetical protein
MMSEDTSSDKEIKAATQSKPELLEEAGAALKSLLRQWLICFGIWVAMLLITRGSPSPTEIGICCVISFLVVAFDESKNVFRNKKKSDDPHFISGEFAPIFFQKVPLLAQVRDQFLKLVSIFTLR